MALMAFDTNDPVTIIIGGPAVAKGRPRVTQRGFVYTPAATRKYESHARLAAQMAMGERAPITAPVKLTALIELPIPTAWSRTRHAAAVVGEIRPTSRPDADNYVKSAMDAINGIVVADDAQVVELEVSKQYGVAPKLVLTVTPLAAASSNRGRA